MSTPSQLPTREQATSERYSKAAKTREAARCCPVDYDPRYLKIIPEQVLERDYGCGDPSRYVNEGDRVLDLGSGGGKIFFIASQIVGPTGRVIGVDMTTDMLCLARDDAPGAPYAEQIIPGPPRVDVPEAQRGEFDCYRSTPRDPRETQGSNYSRASRPRKGALVVN
ncbi:MAG: SAM-dependent methyltransferase [Myxococcota bacterium]|jgi:SAM-dependent methyltransferase